MLSTDWRSGSEILSFLERSHRARLKLLLVDVLMRLISFLTRLYAISLKFHARYQTSPKYDCPFIFMSPIRLSFVSRIPGSSSVSKIVRI